MVASSQARRTDVSAVLARTLAPELTSAPRACFETFYPPFNFGAMVLPSNPGPRIRQAITTSRRP